MARSSEGLAIAQVTPFAWEVDNEVNQYVARVSAQLADRGQRLGRFGQVAQPPSAPHPAR